MKEYLRFLVLAGVVVCALEYSRKRDTELGLRRLQVDILTLALEMSNNEIKSLKEGKKGA